MLTNEDLLKRLMYRYTLTYFVINLSESLATLIDQLIASRALGATAMAAMGLSSPAFSMMSLLCSFFTIGMQTLISNAMNCGDNRKISAVFNTGMLIMSVVALVATFLGLIGVDFVCVLFGASKSEVNVYNSLRQYMLGITAGMIGYMGHIMLSPLAALEGRRRLVTYSVIAQNVLNVAGDLITVKVLHMDTLGLGLSTGLSWNVAFLIVLSGFLRKDTLFKFKLMRPNFKALLEMLTIGSTKFTRYISKIFSKLLINRLVILFGGTVAMSALSVNHSMTGFLLVTGIGVSECVSLCTQMFYSDRDRDYLKKMAGITRKMLVSLRSPALLIALSCFVLASPIAGLFVPERGELRSLTTFSIRCMALQIPVNAINCVLIAYLQGSRRIKLTNVMSFLHRFLSLAVMTLILGLLFGVRGVFAAVPASEIPVALVYLIIALRHSEKGASLTERLLMLPNGFDGDIKSSLSLSVKTNEDVVRVSRQVREFLTGAGIDSKAAVYKTSLCLEEMAANVVNHGFKKDNKKHSCDIRVMLDTDGNILMRVRDDCRLFNILERYRLIDGGDVYSNIGIKVVFAVADEINYIKLLGLNTVLIKLKPDTAKLAAKA